MSGTETTETKEDSSRVKYCDEVTNQLFKEVTITGGRIPRTFRSSDVAMWDKLTAGETAKREATEKERLCHERRSRDKKR